MQLHPSTAKRPTRTKPAIRYFFIEPVGSRCLSKRASRETLDLWLIKSLYLSGLGKWREGVVIAHVGSSAGSKRYQVCRFPPHPQAWKFSQKPHDGLIVDVGERQLQRDRASGGQMQYKKTNRDIV